MNNSSISTYIKLEKVLRFGGGGGVEMQRVQESRFLLILIIRLLFKKVFNENIKHFSKRIN